MSINPTGSSLESQGGLHSSASQTSVNGQILWNSFKCRFGFNRAGMGSMILLFLPDDAGAVVRSVYFELQSSAGHGMGL